MEKRRPPYLLARVKELILADRYRVTRTALQCAARDLGFTEGPQVAACVLTLSARDFYKSMTTLHNSTLWQDVYHHVIGETPVYIKLQIVEEVSVIISFKGLEEKEHA